jgi:Family of unknown function (DUF6117)
MLNPKHLRNFTVLLQAARNGDLALLECKERSTGLIRHVIVAINRDRDGNGYLVMPFGHLCDDPYEHYLPPDPADHQNI